MTARQLMLALSGMNPDARVVLHVPESPGTLVPYEYDAHTVRKSLRPEVVIITGDDSVESPSPINERIHP